MTDKQHNKRSYEIAKKSSENKNEKTSVKNEPVHTQANGDTEKFLISSGNNGSGFSINMNNVDGVTLGSSISHNFNNPSTKHTNGSYILSKTDNGFTATMNGVQRRRVCRVHFEYIDSVETENISAGTQLRLEIKGDCQNVYIGSGNLTISGNCEKVDVKSGDLVVSGNCERLELKSGDVNVSGNVGTCIVTGGDVIVNNSITGNCYVNSGSVKADVINGNYQCNNKPIVTNKRAQNSKQNGRFTTKRIKLADDKSVQVNTFS